jgi:hypothetical protein
MMKLTLNKRVAPRPLSTPPAVAVLLRLTLIAAAPPPTAERKAVAPRTDEDERRVANAMVCFMVLAIKW